MGGPGRGKRWGENRKEAQTEFWLGVAGGASKHKPSMAISLKTESELYF